MSKITIDVDTDQLQMLIINELKRCYIDRALFWKKEPDYEEVSNALLTVIALYSVKSEFDEWYETIKDL